MIEILLSYSELVWLGVLYCVGAFLRGVGKGLGLEWKRRRDQKNIREKFGSPNLETRPWYTKGTKSEQ